MNHKEVEPLRMNESNESIPDIQITTPAEESTMESTQRYSINSARSKNETTDGADIMMTRLKQNSRSHSVNPNENTKLSGALNKTFSPYDNQIILNGANIGSASDQSSTVGTVRLNSVSGRGSDIKLKSDSVQVSGSARSFSLTNKTEKKINVGQGSPAFRKSNDRAVPPRTGRGVRQSLMEAIQEDPLLHPMNEVNKRSFNATTSSAYLKSPSIHRSSKVLEEKAPQKKSIPPSPVPPAEPDKTDVPVAPQVVDEPSPATRDSIHSVTQSWSPKAVHSDLDMNIPMNSQDVDEPLPVALSSIHSTTQSQDFKSSHEGDPNAEDRANLTENKSVNGPQMDLMKEVSLSFHSGKGQPVKITSQDVPLHATSQGTAHSADSNLDESHKNTADSVPVDVARLTDFYRDISPARSKGSFEQNIKETEMPSDLLDVNVPRCTSLDQEKMAPHKLSPGPVDTKQTEPMVFLETKPLQPESDKNVPPGSDLADLEPMVKSAHHRSSEPGILKPSSRVSSQSSDWSPDVMEEEPFNRRQVPYVTLSVAGFCDANEIAYFPLQRQITSLEAKLSESALNYAELEERYEALRKKVMVLERIIKEANIIARDQVVFENLKMNYQLVSSELEEYRMLLREIRKIGWENLPQRMMQDCKEMQEKLNIAKKEKDRALHEESAAKGIANEALKQVKLMRSSIENNEMVIEELEAQQEISRQAYAKAFQRVQEEYEHRTLVQQSRDQRRQAHLESLVEELKAQLEQTVDDDMKDTIFHSSLAYYCPSLEDCRVGLMEVDGKQVEVKTEEQKRFFIRAKLPKEVADALMNPKRSLPECKKRHVSKSDFVASAADNKKRKTADEATEEPIAPEKPERASRHETRKSKTEEPKPVVLRSEEGDAHDPGTTLQDERTAWEQLRIQWESKVREKDKEVTQLKEKIQRMETEMETLRDKRMMEMESDVQMRSLRDENATLYERYQTELALRRKFNSQVQDLKGKVRVFCRLRAAQPSELSKKIPIAVQNSDPYTVMIRTEDGPKYFPFDRVYDGKCTHEQIMEEFGGLIQAAIDGYNVCILVYGSTDSGKLLTLPGDPRDPGLVPRSLTEIFGRLDEPHFRKSFNTNVTISMYELRNDTIIDLLKPTPQILEDTSFSKDNNGIIQIQGLCALSGLCAAEILEHYQRGQSLRAGHHNQGARAANATADHCVTCITIVSTNKLTQITYTGKLTFVELADGNKTQKPNGAPDQTKDGRQFDPTLDAIGDVLYSLHISQASVPYRSSKLTQLLQDSIGGNAKTVMIVHVSPTENALMDTVATLNYGSRVRFVTNDARPISNSEEVMKLQNILGRPRRQE